MKAVTRAWTVQKLEKSIVITFLCFLGSSLTVLFSASAVSGRTLKLDSQNLNGYPSKHFEEIRFQANSLLIKAPDTNEPKRSENRIAQATESPAEATQILQEVDLGTLSVSSDPAAAQQPNLAQQSQNPIANLISVPLQLNTNFGVGEFDRTSVVFNIQPVIPTSISADWTLINRFIVPLAYQPELARIPLLSGGTESIGDVFGLGDIVYQGFLSPKNSGSFTWGIGPILSFPTATDELLGTGQWSAGPAAVGLVTSGRIVMGALINQQWSYAGDGDRSDVSLMTIQPFFNYNFDRGWYVTTSPIITANWMSEPDEQWTVPMGGGFGRVFLMGRQPVNASLQAYWNVVKPEGAADWTIRAQLTLLFP